MTAPKSAAQELRDILDGNSPHPLEGSGCSDHVRRRNLVLSVAGAVILLVILIVLLLV